jgi:hypothetical protein
MPWSLATLWHPLERRLGGLQICSGHCGEEKYLLSPLGMKPQILNRPTHFLVSIPRELSWLFCSFKISFYITVSSTPRSYKWYFPISVVCYTVNTISGTDIPPFACATCFSLQGHHQVQELLQFPCYASLHWPVLDGCIFLVMHLYCINI